MRSFSFVLWSLCYVSCVGDRFCDGVSFVVTVFGGAEADVLYCWWGFSRAAIILLGDILCSSFKLFF